MGTTNRLISEQIEREGPACRGQMAFIGVLDHQHLEHARQRDDGGGRQEDQPRPAGRAADPVRDGEASMRDTISGPVRQHPDDKDAHRQQRHQLDHRLDRDGGDDAVCCSLASRLRVPNRMVNSASPAATQIAVAPRSPMQPFGGVLHEDAEGQRDRLQLQRDIGRAADAEQRDDDAQQVRLAVAAGDQVGDRGDALHGARCAPACAGSTTSPRR
jgi:hypothetical protein